MKDPNPRKKGRGLSPLRLARAGGRNASTGRLVISQAPSATCHVTQPLLVLAEVTLDGKLVAKYGGRANKKDEEDDLE
ncbi:MAG: hypothetical protein OES46_00020 [Gammaproteobacteria bacterium]|jgi:hypothetical protein|nr:hypothetical protein [Gammaproteobacteria bacterium]